MTGVNKVIVVSHLGQNPEIRTTQSGAKIATLSVATSETWKDKATGERREATEWHRVVVFSEGLVGVSERFLRKGSKVYLEGQLKTRKWQAQDGGDRWTTEIVLAAFRGQLVLLDRADRAPTPDETAYGQSPESQPETRSEPRPRRDELDDDIPF